MNIGKHTAHDKNQSSNFLFLDLDKYRVTWIIFPTSFFRTGCFLYWHGCFESYRSIDSGERELCYSHSKSMNSHKHIHNRPLISWFGIGQLEGIFSDYKMVKRFMQISPYCVFLDDICWDLNSKSKNHLWYNRFLSFYRKIYFERWRYFVKLTMISFFYWSNRQCSWTDSRIHSNRTVFMRLPNVLFVKCRFFSPYRGFCVYLEWISVLSEHLLLFILNGFQLFILNAYCVEKRMAQNGREHWEVRARSHISPFNVLRSF